MARKGKTEQMKKTLLATIACMMIAATTCFGTHHLEFDDLGLGGGTATSGTYNPTDTFSFDVRAAWPTWNSPGLSFWLEVPNALAPAISITGVIYGTTFPD